MQRRQVMLGALGASALALGGCAGPQVSDYRHEKPVLELRQYFNGRVDAHGVFMDRSGQVVKRFSVVMDCEWKGAEGVLDEQFLYADGSTQRRVWRITDLGGGRYRGRADDVVGEATGEAAGNTLRWAYTLALPVDGTVYHVQFDDWMILMNDQVMLNRATMSKFGVRLGEVVLSFQKR